MAEKGSKTKGINATYQVVGTQQHSSGYTQYKIIITILSSNSSQELFEGRVIYKRYNEIRNLHKSLYNLHKSLYLPGKFPDFIKPQLFGRFDETVIKQRSKCIQDLLDFICQHKVLHNSKEVRDFLKSSESIEKLDVIGSKIEVLKPTEVTKSSRSAADFTNQMMSSASNDLLQFDPIQSREDIPVDVVRNNWLAILNETVIETPSNNFDSMKSQSSNLPTTSFEDSRKDAANNQHSSDNSANYESFNQSTSTQSNMYNQPDSSMNFATGVGGVSQLRDQHRRLSKARAYLHHVQQQQASPTSDVVKSPTTHTSTSLQDNMKPSIPTKLNEVNSEHRKSLVDLKKLSMDDTELGESYIYVANNYIFNAQQAYFSANYQLAVKQYHIAVDILLQGVQDDTDESRVQAVRVKTAKYLKKAEDIHEKYLHNVVKKSNLMQNIEVNEDTIPNQSEIDLSPSKRSSSPNHTSHDLSDYKIIGTSGKILIAIEESTEKIFAIKVHPKLPHRSKHRRSVIPTNVPYMVKLHKYFSTETSIVLVIEYVPGGKLWDRRQDFFVQDHKHKEETMMKKLKSSSVGEVESSNHSPEKSLGAQNSFPISPKRRLSLHRTNSILSWDEDTNDIISNPPLLDELPNLPSNTDLDLFTIDSVSTNDGNQDSDGSSDSSTQSIPSVGATELLSEQDLSTLASSEEKKFLKIGNKILLEEFSQESSDEDAQIESKTTAINKISLVDPTAVFKHVRKRSEVSTSNICTSNEDFKEVETDPDVFDEKSNLQKAEVLFNQLATVKCYKLPEHVIKGWAAEMVIAIGTLHSIGILCQDFNPNNILLTEDGHIRLTYFGRWRYRKASVQNNRDLNLDQIPPSHYMSPEINKISCKKSEACDWWSLGAILFELFCGKTLHSCYPCGFSTHTILQVSSHVSEEGKSLLTGLLQYHPDQRLGFGPNGLDDLMSHPFFADLDWDSRIEFCDA